jgi:hypothetical protein
MMAMRKEIKTIKTKLGCEELVSHSWFDSFGYGRTKRKINGVKYNLMHRYVYALNFGRIDEKMCVCHKCDNPKCINIDHLFLGSLSDNSNDRHKKGRTSRVSRTSGESNGMSKLTEEQVLEIRKLRNKKTQVKIAEIYNITQTHVSGIQRGVFWSNVGAV